jgi:hypothetical protein
MGSHISRAVMLKYSVIFFVVLLFVLGYFFYSSGVEVAKIKQTEVVVADAIGEKGHHKSIKPKVVEEEGQKEYSSNSTEMVLSKVMHISEKINTKKNTAETALQPKEKVEPLKSIHLEKKLLSSLDVGDIVRIPLDKRAYDVEIKRRVTHPNGDVSLIGKFDYENQVYDAVITNSKKHSFMTMNTPEGSREVELLGDQGWVYDSSAIRDAHMDYSLMDTIEPE